MDFPKVIETTVMFADVVGSSSLYSNLGDDAANRIIARVISMMSEIIRQHGGRVIKTIGDEIMCRFDSVRNCTLSAIRIQESLSKAVPTKQTTLAVRIGFYFGPAILQQNGDLFGNSVNLAAHMASIAKAQQIITTADTIDRLDSDLRAMSRIFDLAKVKGTEDVITLHQIVWDPSDHLTRIELLPQLEKKLTRRLILEFMGRKRTLSSSSIPALLSIGRSPSCDIECRTSFASRSHCTIKLSRGKFFLVDHSSNGTYLQMDGGETFFVKRESTVLWGSGWIGLGQPTVSKDPHSDIRFLVVDPDKSSEAKVKPQTKSGSS